MRARVEREPLSRIAGGRDEAPDFSDCEAVVVATEDLCLKAVIAGKYIGVSEQRWTVN